MWSFIIPKHVQFCLITPNCLDSVFKNLCKCLLVKAITFPIFFFDTFGLRSDMLIKKKFLQSYVGSLCRYFCITILFHMGHNFVGGQKMV